LKEKILGASDKGCLGVFMEKSGYQIFQEESPEIASAFNKLIETIAKHQLLTQKPRT